MKTIKKIILLIGFSIMFLIILGAFVSTLLDIFVDLTSLIGFDIMKNNQINIIRNFFSNIYGPLGTIIFLITIIILFIYLYKQKKINKILRITKYEVQIYEFVEEK